MGAKGYKIKPNYLQACMNIFMSENCYIPVNKLDQFLSDFESE